MSDAEKEIVERPKPCPFCGGKPKGRVCGGDHWLGCQSCHVIGPTVRSDAAAIAMWNSRTDADTITTLHAERDALKARADKAEAALAVPEVWSREEVDAMHLAFAISWPKHGLLETLMAVGAALLRHRLASLTD